MFGKDILTLKNAISDDNNGTSLESDNNILLYPCLEIRMYIDILYAFLLEDIIDLLPSISLLEWVLARVKPPH